MNCTFRRLIEWKAAFRVPFGVQPAAATINQTTEANVRAILGRLAAVMALVVLVVRTHNSSSLYLSSLAIVLSSCYA